MVHKFTKVGAPIFGVGFLIILLTGIIGLAIPPFTLGTGWIEQNQTVSGYSTLDVVAVTQVSHPLFTTTRVSIEISATTYFECNISLVYESVDGLTSAVIRGPSFIAGNFESITYDFNSMIGNSASSRGFSLLVRLENKLNSDITVLRTQASISFSLFTFIIPGIIAVIGLVLIVLGFVKGKSAPSIKQPKPVAGWEPTLQWGGTSGGSTSSRRPKMAIKSTGKAKEPQKTVVKKAAPSGGSQTTCKFCGKQVPANAFFCPHCYGKLR